MKIETTIRRTELTVEKTETLRISRTRRLVYKQCSGHEHDVKDARADSDCLPKDVIETEQAGELSLSVDTREFSIGTKGGPRT